MINQKRFKPFNLDDAMRGGDIRTRNGRRARIIATDRVGDKPIVALVRQKPPSDNDEYYNSLFNPEDCYCYYEDGRYLDYDTDEDLFLVVPKSFVE